MRLMIVVGLVLLSGCTTSAVTMQNPQTAEVVRCGPYSNLGIAGLATPQREAQCIQDYKERGFVRVP